MNTILLDILTDAELRTPATLEATLVQNTSAGSPWLTGVE